MKTYARVTDDISDKKNCKRIYYIITIKNSKYYAWHPSVFFFDKETNFS